MLLPGTWDTSWGERFSHFYSFSKMNQNKNKNMKRSNTLVKSKTLGAHTLGPGWMFCLWLFLALLASLPVPNTSCPRSCFCNTISYIVYCSRRGLPYIPEGIPKESLQLNLNGNVFKTNTLQRANFSQYPELEHLYLSECGIEKIEVETFVDLSNLKWLDLSNNRIKVIEDFTFRGLALMHLFLNGNRNIQIKPNSFKGLEANGLYLHDCSLKKIEVDVVAPLNSTLRYLWLNGNEMERVDKKLLSLFKTLSHLRLGVNPLHCNCEIQWLKEFYDRSEETFKGAVAPSCLTPARLKGKYFNQMSQYDFQCKPPVFTNIDARLDEEAGHLRCTASGDPAPTLFWIKPSGESAKYAPPADEDIHLNEGILAFSSSPSSSSQGKQSRDLSGMYICLAYNEAGNVTLTLNVNWPKSSGSKSTVVDYQHHQTISPPPFLAKDNERGRVDESTSIPPTIPPSSQNNNNKNHHKNGDGFSSNKNKNKNKHHRKHHHPHEEVDMDEDEEDLFTEVENGHNNFEVELDSDIDHRQNVISNNGGKDITNKEKSYNFTALNMLDFNRRKGERMFNITELVGAVIGTHVCTLLLCLIFMPIYLKKQWKRRQHNSHHHTLEKQPPNETLYLNGLGHVHDYLDTPNPKR